MKKIILFISLALIAFAGNTQTSAETTCLPTKDLQDGLFVIRVLKEKSDLLQVKIDSLNARIALLKENEVDYKASVSNLQTQIDLCDIQKSNYEQKIAILRPALDKALKDYRRQKRKTVFVGIAGALFAAASILKPF